MVQYEKDFYIDTTNDADPWPSYICKYPRRTICPGYFEGKSHVSQCIRIERRRKRTIMKSSELRPKFYNRLTELNSIFLQ